MDQTTRTIGEIYPNLSLRYAAHVYHFGSLSTSNSPSVSLSTHTARPHTDTLSLLSPPLPSFSLPWCHRWSKDREKNGVFDRRRRIDGRTGAHSLLVTTCYRRRRTTVEPVTTLTLLFFLENLESYMSMFSHVYEFCLFTLLQDVSRTVESK